MRQVTATGQTVDEAIQSALKQLNITEDQASIEIIDEGKKRITRFIRIKACDC